MFQCLQSLFHDIYIVLFIFSLCFNDGDGKSNIIGTDYFQFCSNDSDIFYIAIILLVLNVNKLHGRYTAPFTEFNLYKT